MYVRMYVCMFAFMHACVYVWMCMCMCVCMHASIYVHICGWSLFVLGGYIYLWLMATNIVVCMYVLCGVHIFVADGHKYSCVYACVVWDAYICG